MVQKDKSVPEAPVVPAKRKRGRPRAYDPRAALRAVTEAFWRSGYSGTSLDDLSAAAGMNRPSLYAAFGDKRELYLAALDRYWENGYRAMDEVFSKVRPLREALMELYERALTIYFPQDSRPRGCFAIGTATTESVLDPKIRVALAGGVHRLDSLFEARIRVSQKRGELSPASDPATLGMLASATLHTIAIRARAGVERDELRELARRAVDVICRS
jgi:AcrR family transcriptional regulator